MLNTNFIFFCIANWHRWANPHPHMKGISMTSGSLGFYTHKVIPRQAGDTKFNEYVIGRD
jgi:hypothetical protein